MKVLNQYWFAITNGVVFLAFLIFYFVSVSGFEGERKDLDSSLQSKASTLKSMKDRRPTSQWDQNFVINETELNKQAGVVLDYLKAADDEFENFFDLEVWDVRSSTPPTPAEGPRFKSVLVKKWDVLQDKYAPAPPELTEDKADQGSGMAPPTFGGGIPGEFLGSGSKATRIVMDDEKPLGPFYCLRETLVNLEPTWLRKPWQWDLNEAREAQKQYWLVEQVLDIVEKEKIMALTGFKVMPLKPEPNSEHSGKYLWSSRDMELVVELAASRARTLMKSLEASPLLLRVVGFEQKNLNTAPPGVNSSALFISFKESPSVSLKLHLRHYDSLSNEESDKVKQSLMGPGQ